MDGVCSPSPPPLFGMVLLIRGIDKYGGRKIHYTMDIIMALCWAFACGFSSPLPYWYPLWVSIVLIHRAIRDVGHCRKKYGEVTSQSYRNMSNTLRNGMNMNDYVHTCLY